MAYVQDLDAIQDPATGAPIKPEWGDAVNENFRAIGQSGALQAAQDAEDAQDDVEALQTQVDTQKTARDVEQYNQDQATAAALARADEAKAQADALQTQVDTQKTARDVEQYNQDQATAAAQSAADSAKAQSQAIADSGQTINDATTLGGETKDAFVLGDADDFMRKNPTPAAAGQWVDMVLPTDPDIFIDSTTNVRKRMSLVFENIVSQCEAGFKLEGGSGGQSDAYAARFQISTTGFLNFTLDEYTSNRVTIDYDGPDDDFDVFAYHTSTGKFAIGIETWQKLFRCSVHAQRGRYADALQPGVSLVVTSTGVEV